MLSPAQLFTDITFSFYFGASIDTHGARRVSGSIEAPTFSKKKLFRRSTQVLTHSKHYLTPISFKYHVFDLRNINFSYPLHFVFLSFALF